MFDFLVSLNIDDTIILKNVIDDGLLMNECPSKDRLKNILGIY